MSSLICGLYSYDAAANSLTHVFSQQSIRLTHQNDEGGLWYEYSDPETALDFVVEKTVRPYSFGAYETSSTALLDFNRPECQTVSLNYGLWRRVTFFLLDSLPVWFFLRDQREAFRKVSVLGAWTNSTWNSSAGLQAHIDNPISANLTVTADDTQYPLAALDLRPLPWEFCENTPPPLEFSLRYDSSTSPELPVLSHEFPIFDQLQDVPFFCRVDRNAFLYPRYAEARLHFGDGYVVDPCYGYVNERCGFTIRATNSWGVDTFFEPALASPQVHFEDCFRTTYRSDQYWSVALSAPLREELLFALLDITALPTLRLPAMTARNEAGVRHLEKATPWRLPDQMHVVFGSHLWELRDLPMTTGLGMTHVSFRLPYWEQIAPRNVSH